MMRYNVIPMSDKINKTVLMSGPDYFADTAAINAYMDSSVPIDIEAAQREHELIKASLEKAGVKVEQVAPPKDCQDGVYTANWALVRGDKAIMACVPNAREQEIPYAEQVLRDLGKKIIHPPKGYHFSGQGDALACGNYLFAGHGYRTDEAMHRFVAEQLGYNVVTLQAVPKLDDLGQPVTNKASGWADSFFYDIDLALSILRAPTDGQNGLIAWCPEAFMPESQERMRALPIEKIEVSLEEATQGFACNLVSTGETVVMSAHAPELKAAIEAYDLQVVTPDIQELAKGGGYIRCTTLTLDNA